MSNIIDTQTNVIKYLMQEFPFETSGIYFKDNIAEKLSRTEFPLCIVDLHQTNTADLSSGNLLQETHILILSFYSLVGESIGDARKASIEGILSILDVLGKAPFDGKIEYTDTILADAKVCAAGCMLEFNDNEYYIIN